MTAGENKTETFAEKVAEGGERWGHFHYEIWESNHCWDMVVRDKIAKRGDCQRQGQNPLFLVPESTSDHSCSHWETGKEKHQLRTECFPSGSHAPEGDMSICTESWWIADPT